MMKAAFLSMLVFSLSANYAAQAQETDTGADLDDRPEIVDPRKKAGLAVAQGQAVLKTIRAYTKADPQFDRMCLRLGRFSAIMKANAKVYDKAGIFAPSKSYDRAEVYESFCGQGKKHARGAAPNAAEPGTGSSAAVQSIEREIVSDMEKLKKYSTAK